MKSTCAGYTFGLSVSCIGVGTYGAPGGSLIYNSFWLARLSRSCAVLKLLPPAVSNTGTGRLACAVGIPASLLRFAALHSYDNVREPRLPPELRDKNPTGTMWRKIDGEWTQGEVPVSS